MLNCFIIRILNEQLSIFIDIIFLYFYNLHDVKIVILKYIIKMFIMFQK